MHSKWFPPQVQDPSAAPESPSPNNLLSSAVYQEVRLPGVLHLHLLPPLPFPPLAGQARLCHSDEELSKSLKASKLHQWFNSSGHFTEGVDFAYW